jgi:hypothetical protein
MLLHELNLSDTLGDTLADDLAYLLRDTQVRDVHKT